jgi:hypothetical protein
MVVVVTSRVHHRASVPKGSAPAAPVRVGVIGVENEPTAFHLSIAELLAAPACHLASIEGKIHVLGSVPVEVVHPQLADALRKTTGWKRIGPAPCPASTVAAGRLGA